MADTPKQDRDLHLPRTQVGNRWFTRYDPEIALDIIIHITEGETLASICAKGSGRPATSTFYRWAREHKELRDAYQAAKEISAFAFEDEALETARTSYQNPGTNEKLRAANMLIDQLRWSAARRNPASFNDRGNQALIVPINIQTTLDVGDENSVSSKGGSIPDNDIFELTLNPLEEKNDQNVNDRIVPTRDPHAPRKRILQSRAAEGEKYIHPSESDVKMRKNRRDREKWRIDHEVKPENMADESIGGDLRAQNKPVYSIPKGAKKD